MRKNTTLSLPNTIYLTLDSACQLRGSSLAYCFRIYHQCSLVVLTDSRSLRQWCLVCLALNNPYLLSSTSSLRSEFWLLYDWTFFNFVCACLVSSVSYTPMLIHLTLATNKAWNPQDYSCDQESFFILSSFCSFVLSTRSIKIIPVFLFVSRL